MAVMIRTPQVQGQSAATEASGRADVRVTNPFGVLGVQTLERTYGKPRVLGDGARDAVHRFGDALEELAE